MRLFSGLGGLNVLFVQTDHLWDNQRLDLDVSCSIRLREAHPFHVLRRYKHHLLLSRGQNVANYQMMLVPLKSAFGLANQQIRIGLKLERDHHAFGRPVVNQALEKLGHGVQVNDQALATWNFGRPSFFSSLLESSLSRDQSIITYESKLSNVSSSSSAARLPSGLLPNLSVLMSVLWILCSAIRSGYSVCQFLFTFILKEKSKGERS